MRWILCLNVFVLLLQLSINFILRWICNLLCVESYVLMCPFYYSNCACLSIVLYLLSLDLLSYYPNDFLCSNILLHSNLNPMSDHSHLLCINEALHLLCVESYVLMCPFYYSNNQSILFCVESAIKFLSHNDVSVRLSIVLLLSFPIYSACSGAPSRERRCR